MTRFDKDHDQLRGLYELNRIERPAPQVELRYAPRDRVIDAAIVEGLQNLLGGPGLVRRRPSPFHRCPSGIGHPNSLVGLLPGSNLITAGLPDSRKIRFSICGPR